MRVRSILFAPGNDEHKLRTALDQPADVVVADLEDSVPDSEKAEARAIVGTILKESRRDNPTTFVRLNGKGSDHHEADLEAVALIGVDGLVVPKAAEPIGVACALPTIAIIETASGISNQRAIAQAPNVVALLLGSIDLALNLNLEPRSDGAELAFFRSSMVVESALAGLISPIDGVHADVRDLDGLREECATARAFGMGGKACIHPGQVPIVNQSFAPTQQALDTARRIIDAYEVALASGSGVTELDGVMIDWPVVVRARRLLEDETSPCN